MDGMTMQVRGEWLDTVDAIRDPLMVHDEELRVVRCNRAYAKRAGKSFAEILGRPYWQAFPKGTGPLAQCDNSEGGDCAGSEALTKVESGEIFLSRAFPLRDSRGASQTLHLFEDMTERHRAEEELLYKNALLIAQRECSLDGILVVDDQRRIVSYNSRFCQMWGFPERVLAEGPDDGAVAFVLERMQDPASFLASIERMYDEKTLTVRDTLQLKDGQVFERYSRPLTAREGRNYGRVLFFRDVTSELRSAEALRRANRALRTLSAGNVTVVKSTDESELVARMAQVIVEEGGYALAFVGYHRDDPERSVDIKAGAGIPPDILRAAPLRWGADEPGPSTTAWLAERGIESVLALPISPAPDEPPLGVMVIGARESDAFAEDERKVLEELAGDLAYGIATIRTRRERESAHAKLRGALENTVAAIAAAMQSRDPYTAGHQRRVADLAAAIGREMGLDEDTLEGITFGALIHDIGKIQIPAEILAKPSRLTNIEFDLIKTHPEAGYEIVKGIDFPWPVAQMVLQHHERLDGSGYPRGLRGEEITREARILAVADVVEAMASHRPYRAGLGVEAALAEILAKRGQSFDAQAVDACVRLFREKGYTLDKDALRH
jgi:putative nucleotidyltransferase with HDIG domain